MANNDLHSHSSNSRNSHNVDPVPIQIQQPTPSPPPQVLAPAPSRKNTMTKLKTIFGHHAASKKQPSKSNGSSHESSRANSPLQTPISSPDLKPYSNGLLRQPSATNILTQGVVSSKSNGTNSPAGSIHSVPSNTAREQQASGSQRIVVWEDGHEHHLKSARRQEKLGGMLRDLLGTGKKIKDDAVSAMPDFVQKDDDGLSLISGLVNQIQNGEKEVNKIVKHAGGVGLPSGASTPTVASATGNSQNLSLLQKYGKCQEIIGKGAYGIVRVAHKYDAVSRREMLFAVKEFKRRPSEDEQSFSKRLASEFCISSSLHHPNIIHTLDLMRDARGECCEVMEYCAGGDLYSLILASEGGLEVTEANCFFKQLMRGVVYMHSMGVAHCDLKPENLLLTCNGVLKISDFGNGECFRMAWEKEIHLSSGVCGSRPYIAPEEFRESEFDPRAVDIWATGVIYMAMRTGSYLWQVAVPDEDEFYRKYLQGRKQSSGYEPIENLKKARCRNVIYSILDPIPSRRITGKQIINSEWGRSIQVCDAAERGY